MNHNTSATSAARLKQYISIGLIVLLATGRGIYQLSIDSSSITE